MEFDFAGLCFTNAAGMPFSHDWLYVAISFVIAASGSYTALDLAERRRRGAGREAFLWRLTAASTLGASIWAMHFMGMLAFRLDLPTSYDIGLTLSSLLLSIVSAGTALELVVQARRRKVLSIMIGSLLLGSGIVGMHYVGMAALRLPGSVAYLPSLWSLSVTIAIAAALASLWILERLPGSKGRALAAIGMACAICGMHYVGMAATVVRYDPFVGEGGGISPHPLAIGIVVATTALLLLALGAAGADRRLTAASLREASMLRGANEELRRSQREIVARLCQANELRDDDTGLHCRRMAMVSHQLALAAGCDAEFAERILDAAPLHDIGKIGIADRILLKPGKLDLLERSAMQRHAEIGAEILEGSSLPLVQLSASIARSHHERWDGTGYPRGLSREEIPLAGRIVAVADVFDALMSDRPYKSAWSPDEIARFFRAESGKHFDPALVAALMGRFDDIVRLWRQYSSMPSHPTAEIGESNLASDRLAPQPAVAEHAALALVAA